MIYTLRKHGGFSLIEVLLAITFSMALIWQIVTIYLDIHRTHQLQTQISQIMHHGQWFQEVMSSAIGQSGNTTCLPTNQKNTAYAAAQTYKANTLPKAWSITAAPKTDVLLLASCQPVSQQNQHPQQIQTAYYLKKNANNNFYTLYKKIKNQRAIAMQDDIQSLYWYLAYQTATKGALTAPQAVGYQTTQPVKAVAWQVKFSQPIFKQSQNTNHLLTRNFYGYQAIG